MYSKSREDRLKELERERQLYSSSLLNQDTRSNAFDYLHPEFTKSPYGIPGVRIQHNQVLVDNQEDTIPVRFGTDSVTMEKSKSPYLDLDQIANYNPPLRNQKASLSQTLLDIDRQSRLDIAELRASAKKEKNDKKTKVLLLKLDSLF